MKNPAKNPCPCGSGRLYRDCCSPYHRGLAEPPDAEALMRSRYSAFALKEAAYLFRSLHPDHPDHAQGPDTLARAIKSSPYRYMGLAILDKELSAPPLPSRVLFLAKVFERGHDVSFLELSDFFHDGTGWRYHSGIPALVGERKPSRLSIEEFLRSIQSKTS